MSPHEFTEWAVMLEEEPMGADATWVMWSRLMAAITNGPMTRNDRRAHDARDFLVPRWQPAPDEVPKPAKGSAAQALKRFIASKRGKA